MGALTLTYVLPLRWARDGGSRRARRVPAELRRRYAERPLTRNVTGGAGDDGALSAAKSISL